MRVPVRRRAVVAGAAMMAAVGLAAAGCGWDDAVDSRAATAGLPSTQADVEAHDWVLDRSASSLTAADETPVTLAVAGDDVSGAAPCNTYRGTFDLGADDSVEIRDIAVTQMACEAPVMEAEDEYLAALAAVDHVEVDVDDEGRDDRDRMTLTGDDGLRLAFRAYDARDQLTGEWVVTGVATGDAIESVLVGTEPALTFAEDGDLAVDTGCNTGGSDWELDGQDLTVGAVRLTRKACADPPGVMDQEAAIVAALESTATVEITPGSLTLLDGDGRIALTAVQG
jgi:heat shock protein HslJ